MAKRSVDFADRRAVRIERLAAAFELSFADMVLRLVDLGMASLPPALPDAWAFVDDEVPAAGDFGPDEQEPLPEAATPAPDRRQQQREAQAEIQARVEECFKAYQRAFVRFRKHADGVDVPPPRWNGALQPWIVAALRKHDADLLGPEQRVEWKKQSKVRAAAIGIFMSPWHNGSSAENNLANGGRRYLEPERCWRQMQGKVDPVETFSALYFEQKLTAPTGQEVAG